MVQLKYPDECELKNDWKIWGVEGILLFAKLALEQEMKIVVVDKECVVECLTNCIFSIHIEMYTYHKCMAQL